MLVETADQDIVAWAAKRSAPCYYTHEEHLPQPCLKVHCGHVTAYFCGGRLARLWAHADHTYLDDLFAELTDLFALCARLKGGQQAGPAVAGFTPRLRWGDSAPAG